MLNFKLIFHSKFKIKEMKTENIILDKSFGFALQIIELYKQMTE